MQYTDSPVERGDLPLVTVVVPTFRRLALLERCLYALGDQALPKSFYDVIVVDDDCDPAVQRLVAQINIETGSQLRCLMHTTGCGPAAARNMGWRSARGSIIAFTDDDCIPARSWLRAIVDACVPGVDGGWGRIIVPCSDRPTDYEREVAKLEECQFVTANCFCRREVLERIGGFDERFVYAWREDSDLYFNLLEQGAELRKVPAACVVHPVRSASWGISIRLQRNSMFNALLYKKHPTLYRQHIEPGPPLLYYTMVGLLTFALVQYLGDFRSGAVASLAGWSAALVVFLSRRAASVRLDPPHLAELLVTSIVIPPLSVFWRIYGAIKFRVPFA